MKVPREWYKFSKLFMFLSFWVRGKCPSTKSSPSSFRSSLKTYPSILLRVVSTVTARRRKGYRVSCVQSSQFVRAPRSSHREECTRPTRPTPPLHSTSSLSEFYSDAMSYSVTLLETLLKVKTYGIRVLPLPLLVPLS